MWIMPESSDFISGIPEPDAAGASHATDHAAAIAAGMGSKIQTRYSHRSSPGSRYTLSRAESRPKIAALTAKPASEATMPRRRRNTASRIDRFGRRIRRPQHATLRLLGVASGI